MIPVKKLCCILAILLMLPLSACAKTISHPADPVFVFESDVQITAGDQTYECRLSRQEPKTTAITISEPEELSGMIWNWNGEDFAVSYAGLTVDREKCILPSNSFIAQLAKTLDAAASPESLTTSGDGLYYGSLNGENFTVAADLHTGTLTELEIPGRSIKAVFIS